MMGLKTPLFPYKSAQASADECEARELSAWLAAQRRKPEDKRGSHTDAWSASPYATSEPDVRGPIPD
ncbi:MAG: hypothetical protein JOZ75_11400 [Candidatus Dormibacteraeota bacterium]|nr:hypothetical protein [Candidatus Dormibacteraeota bacterium]